ncbi:MAG: CRTAC1 family protein [Limisphaerales bacterium]
MPRLRLVFLLSLLLLAIGVALWRRDVRTASRGAAPQPAPATAARSGLTEPALLPQLLALEAGRAEVDRSVWAAELEADRHEAPFNGLWDSLRRSADPLELLSRFPFGVLTLGQAGPAQRLSHDIRLHRFAGSGTTVAPAEWRRRIAAWRHEGWRLDGSEWRHVRFEPATNGPARSVFTVELHLEQPSALRRAIVRGRLRVEWAALATASDPPFPQSITADETVIYERAGPPLFEPAVRETVVPDPGSISIDPLILRDLDGDGRDEIILAGKNRVYWNRGGGVFQGTRLSPQLKDPPGAAVFGDFDGDGSVDFLAVDNEGLVLCRRDTAGNFTGGLLRQLLPDLFNPYALTSGDVDGDGDLDLWLVQYKVPYRYGQMPTPYYDANDGFPSYLLVNDGHGGFRDATAESGLAAKRFRRSYSASFCDLDRDGDLDLVNVSDFAGVDLHLNDGRGRFTDVTAAAVPEPRLFGMAHAIADFDGDARPDLLAVGMNSPAASRMDHLGLGPPGFEAHSRARAAMTFGNRAWLNRGDAAALRLEPAPFAAQIAMAGWAWGVAAFDMDNDGDLDLHLANGHQSRPSVQDYDAQFWRHDIHVAGSATNALVALYFDAKSSRHHGAGESYGGHQRNVLFLNAGTAGWHEVAWLLGVALPEDSRAVAACDLDGDGSEDLIVTTDEVWPERRQTLRVFRSRHPAGQWLAVRLVPGPDLREGEPAEVTLHTAAGPRRRWLVTGAGYRTQADTVAHFGLGSGERVACVEVRQCGAVVWRMESPRTRTMLRAGEAARP